MKNLTKGVVVINRWWGGGGGKLGGEYSGGNQLQGTLEN